MGVRIIDKAGLRDTDRHLRTDALETFRFLLAEDGVGVTVTDIVLAPGIEAEYGYDDHIEIAYCIEGAATLTDLATGATSEIAPGIMWVADKGARFLFRASVPTRLICVFNPPFASAATGTSSVADAD